MKGRAILGALCLSVVLCASGCNKKKTINLTDYVTVTYDGYSGYAGINVDIDKERLEKDLVDKGIYDAEKAKAFVLELKTTTSVKVATNGKPFKISFGLEKQAEITAFPEGVNTDPVVVKPENLEQAKEIDPFAAAAVSLKGISPKITPVIDGIGYEYVLSHKGFLAAGDVLKITITATAPEGCVFTQTEKEYMIGEKTNHFLSKEEVASNLDTVDSSCKQTLMDEAKDNTKRLVYRMTHNKDYLGSSSNEYIEDSTLVQCLYLTEKTLEDGKDNNYLYMIYKASVSNDLTTEEGYFVFEFPNVYMAGEEYKFGLEHAKDYYKCDKDLEVLKEELIKPKEKEYVINTLK